MLDLSSIVMKVVPDQDNPAHRDGTWKPNISHYP